MVLDYRLGSTRMRIINVTTSHYGLGVSILRKIDLSNN